MDKNLYVQYGCGWSAPAQWRNFDASPTLRFERIPLIGQLYTKNDSRFPDNVEYGNIVNGLPVPKNACKGVYCSHILEHLSLNDFRTALKNTKEILEPSGTFRLVVPDLEWQINDYLKDTSDEAASHFMRETYLGITNRPKGIKGILQAWLGNSNHLWMWDYKNMKKELEAAGFVDIRRAKFGDSTDAHFSYVENEGRWTNCLGIECKKAQ